MSQSQASARRKPRENNFLFDLGKKGRKTGITVPEGVRDEHGMETLDHLFSSPTKVSTVKKGTRSAAAKNANMTLSSEEDMDIGQSTIPEPTEVLTARKRTSMRMPPPRSRSPIKTYLQSPARRHPSLGPMSSPLRGSIVSPSRVKPTPSVVRKLDFSVDSLGGNVETTLDRDSPPKRPTQHKTTPQSPGRRANLGTPNLSQRLKQTFQSNDENAEPTGETDQDMYPGTEAVQDNSYQLVDADDDVRLGEEDFQNEVSMETEATSTRKPIRKRGRQALGTETAVKKGKSQPPKRSIEEAIEQEIEDERPTKKLRGKVKPAAQTTKKNGPAAPKSKPRKRASSLSKVLSPVEVQRGPPRPRQNKGLFILRRETPDLGNGFSQTRSGRQVVKPLEYWKGETVVYGEDEDADGDESFLLPTIKEVVRAESVDEPEPSKPRSRKASAKPKKHRIEPELEDDDDLAEPWESEPGRIFGDVRTWNPEDPTGIESEIVDDELALSKAAIITRDIPGQTFKFAKTLTLPFFGSGMVDLPPGGVKRPKNSRRMQMVFVVLEGRVSVTVNETAFRIGKGGIWQVPRGNFYSIENDYDSEARIFFAQGCVVQEEFMEEG